MISLASYPLTTALAQALMHFVWQGALIGLIAFAVWRLRRFSSHARYLTGILALAAMLIAPLATTAYLMKTAAPPATTLSACSPIRMSSVPLRTQTISRVPGGCAFASYDAPRARRHSQASMFSGGARPAITVSIQTAPGSSQMRCECLPGAP